MVSAFAAAVIGAMLIDKQPMSSPVETHQKMWQDSS